MGKHKATWTPTQREVQRMLECAGFRFLRPAKGDHAVWRRKYDGSTAVVPTGHPTRKVSQVVYRSVKEALKPGPNRFGRS